jgi:hypothetical protein
MLTDLSTAWQGSPGRHVVQWGSFGMVMAGRRYQMYELNEWTKSHVPVFD